MQTANGAAPAAGGKVDPPVVPAGLQLASSYLLSGAVLAVLVLAMLGWDSLAMPWLLVGDTVLAVVVGLLVLLAHRQGRQVPLAVQNVIAIVGVGLISGTSFAIGGAEGAIFACTYAFALAIVAMHYPLRIVLSLLGVVAAMYAVVVATSGGTVAQWALVVLVAAASGVLTGRYHRRTRRLATRLQSMESWRAMLMASLAHDLRSPLGMADSTMQLLQSKSATLTEDQRTELLGAARRHQHRALQLTNDLLDHERVHAGTLMLTPEPTVLADAVREACSHVPVEVCIETPEDVVVRADPARLQQVLVNLVHNATKYGAAPIVIGADEQDGVVTCWVRDHGPGLPAELEARLFSAFAAGDADDAVGLGLWIVQQLVVAHGGTIVYEDAGPGARFRWTMAAASVSTGQATDPSQRPTPPESAARRAR